MNTSPILSKHHRLSQILNRNKFQYFIINRFRSKSKFYLLILLSMSNKPRARRNRNERKEFVEKEEPDNQNVIGVLDDDNNKNKIEQKQEDMFDPRQLQQNMLNQAFTSNTNHNAFIDFQDGDTKGETDIAQKQTENTKKQVQSSARKQRKRQRGKREAKKFDSQQEGNIQQEEKVEQKPPQNVFQPEQLEDQEIEMPTSEIPKIEKQEKREQNQKQEQQARLQEERMKQMVAKKPPQVADNYVYMHILMNKAGSNKQQRKIAIYTPLQPNQHSFVYFKRYQSGFSQYYQVIGQDQRPILFCQNQRGCIGCNYYISLTKQMDKNNPAYLGKLRGNAAGSIYQLYDKGIQPNNDYDRSKFRVSMAYIEYQSNFLGMKGPRKFKAVVPNVQCHEDFDMFKFSEQESLNDFKGNNVIRLRNKQPRWNQRLKSYALNFGGRVKQASIKNFILVDQKYNIEEEDKAPNAVIFGKIDENTFALQFGYPLSLFQAFGIAMSEFDFKLKCE